MKKLLHRFLNCIDNEKIRELKAFFIFIDDNGLRGKVPDPSELPVKNNAEKRAQIKCCLLIKNPDEIPENDGCDIQGLAVIVYHPEPENGLPGRFTVHECLKKNKISPLQNKIQYHKKENADASDRIVPEKISDRSGIGKYIDDIQDSQKQIDNKYNGVHNKNIYKHGQKPGKRTGNFIWDLDLLRRFDINNIASDICCDKKLLD